MAVRGYGWVLGPSPSGFVQISQSGGIAKSARVKGHQARAPLYEDEHIKLMRQWWL
jgi:hypothetical protein